MPNAVVRFHRLAAAEYRSASDRYRKSSAAAVRRFRMEVKRVVQRLAAGPNQGAVFRGPYRWMRLRRFPYLLYYRLITPNMVLVYAVAHSRRRAGYWLHRATRP
jgi:plasmid stabilization system protein ParE